METFLLGLSMIAVLFFLGYGFTALALSKLEKEKIWLSPWVGVVLIAVYAPVLLFGRVPMILGVFIFFMFALVMNIYTFYKTYPHLSKKLKFLIPSAVLVSLSTFLLLNSAEIRRIANTLAESVSKNSAVFNLSIIKDGHFIGIYSIIDFFTNLLKQKTIVIAGILPTVFLAMFLPIAFIFSRFFFLRKNNFVRLAMSLSASLLFYLFFYYYKLSLEQLVFSELLFFVSIIFLLGFANRISKAKKDVLMLTSLDVLLTISLFSSSSIYPPGFKILCVLFAVSVLASLITKNTDITFLLIKIFSLSVIINPIIISMAFSIK